MKFCHTKWVSLGLIVFSMSILMINQDFGHAQADDNLEIPIETSSIFDDSYYKIEDSNFSVKIGDKNTQNDDQVSFQTYPQKEVGSGLIAKTVDWWSKKQLGINWQLIKATDSTQIQSEIDNYNQQLATENDQTGISATLNNWLKDFGSSIKNQWQNTLNIGQKTDDLFLTDNNKKIINPSEISDVSLEYETINNGLKENIIIEGSENQVFDSYLYELNLDSGVILHRAQNDQPFGLTAGTYYFTDENNNYLAHFLPLVAYDANGLETKNISMEILPAYGRVSNLSVQYFIAITVDKNWLTDPAIQYPIKIDPSIVHDTKAEFDSGTLNRLQTTVDNRIKLKQHELAADSSTIALWHLNESTGQVANDASGNGNNGRLGSTTSSDTNDPTWNTTSQKFGASALTFDGTDDYVTMGDKDVFSFADNKFTISFWMKANDTTSLIGVLGKRGSPWEYSIHTNTAGTLTFYTWTSDGGNIVYPYLTTAYDTSWTNYTFTADGTRAYLYKNGQLVSSSLKNSAYNLSNSTANFEIGRGGDASGIRYMNGLIDEVKISNRALSPEEIKQDAQYSPYGVYTSSVIDLSSTTPTFNNFSWHEQGVRTSSIENDINTTNLVAQWNFNETSGTTATSAGSCGTSCNGTLTSFANTSSQDATPMSGWTYENRLEYGADGDGSLMFDGTDDYAEVANNSTYNFNTNDNFTISFWANIPTTQTNTSAFENSIIEKWTNTGPYPFAIRLSNQTNTANGRIHVLRYDGTNAPQLSSNRSVNDNQWHQVNFVKNGSTLYLYVDGTLENTAIDTTVSTTQNSANLTFGRRSGSDSYNFKGIIESPKIYSRALSADEINSNYQAGNIEFQTRTGSDTTPEDGGWEDWKSTGSAAETAVDNLDSNVDNSGVYDWTIQNIGTNQNWIKKNNSIPTTSDTTSTDGRIPLGTTGKGDVSHTTAPKVIKDGDTYKMWYCGVNNTNILIYYATSPDGLNWTKVDNTIPSGTCDSNGSPCSYGNGRLGVGSSGRGDSSSVTTAAVIKDGSTYKMWYTASNGVNARIYYATSSDGLTWTKVNNNIPTGNCDSSINHNTPCSYGDGRLSLGSSGMADSNSVSVGNVIKDGDIYKMWYTANNGTYSTIAYAYSNDGLTWVKYDNTIPTISDYYGTNGRLSKGNTGTAESNYVNGPFVIKDSSVYKMWYVGQDGNYSYVLYATSLDGINWTKFDNTKPAVSDSSNTNGRIGNGTSSKSDTSKIFSPSVLVDNGIYRIWYQGSSTGSTVYRITYASMSSLPYTQKTDSTLKIEGAGSERCLIGQSQADAGTVGLWHFEETGGSGAYIKDSSGNGNNGTPTGTTAANGISGKGRSFNGTNEYISIGSPASLNLAGEMTAEAWIYPKNVTVVNQFLGQASSGGTDGQFNFEIGRTANKLSIYWGGLSTPLLSSGSLYANNWYHVAFTRTGSTGNWTMKIYINGVLDSVQTTTTNPGTQQPTDIGKAGDYPAYYFNGNIDEIKISNVARTSEEIAAAYRLGADYHITRTLSSPINLATTNNKLPFQIASDRPGTSFMLTLGESSYANYELDSNTIGYWPLEENFSGNTNTMRECTDADAIGTACGGGIKFATGLVAMPSGCANSTSEPTCSGNDVQTARYSSTMGTNEPADSTSDGMLNTVNLFNASTPTNPASDFCYNLTKNGYIDWYLPAQSELQSLYSQRTTVGGFISSQYWTSTEYSDTTYSYAYYVHFSTGGSTYGSKLNSFYYRCIRRYNSDQYKIKDTSTTNHSGQAVGTSPAQGKFGNGRYFTGTSDTIQFPDSDQLKNLSSFSIEGWFYPTNINSTNVMSLVGKITDSTTADYWLRILQNGATQISFANSSGTQYALNGPTLSNNQWYYLVGSYNPSSGFKIYINGVLSASGCTTPAVCTGSAPRQTTASLYFGGPLISTAAYNGVMDEIRISNTIRTATEIRQAYEIGQRSHPITIDFGAGLDSGNLITGSSDLSFTVDATKKGLSTKGENLFIGDKIIIKENYNGTEYSAQGTVTSVNKSTGAVTVAAWDSGATFPSIGYSANADVFKWQKEIASIYGSLAGHRDNINTISWRLLDAKQGQSVWLDDLKISTPLITNPTTNTVQSTPNRYFQYRALVSTTDTDPTPSVDDVELDYTTLEITGGSTSQSYINTNNNTAFNIQCNGATDGTTGNNVDCQASFNQTNWYTVGSATTPLANQTIQGTPDISSWTGYPSGDGSVTIYVRAHNTINDTYSTIRNFSVNKDVSRPAVTVITSVAGDTTSPYSDGTDDGSTLVVYTTTADAISCRWSETDQTYGAMTNTCTSTTNCTLNLSGKGQKDVYFGCLDTATNYSQPNYHLTYYIDIDPDIVAVDAGPSSSDRNSLTSDQWFNYSQTGSDDQISFSWTDPSSPSDDTFYYVLNTTATNFITDGSEEGVTTTTNNYLDDIDISENVSYLHVRAKNGVNSWGTERIFIVKYDKTNPTISADNSSDQWYGSNPTITLNTADTYSGLDYSKYSWDSDEATCRVSGTSFDNSDTINIISSGSHVLYLCNEDNVNNQGSWSGVYKLDSSTPNILSLDAGPSSSDRTSLTSDQWFNYIQAGSDDQISFVWTDPNSTSDDYFYYLENDSTANAFDNTGLVGWWSFENDNTTTAFDHSGNNNNGALDGTTLSTGQLGNARNFNGASDRIIVTDNSLLDPNSDSFSISFWVKPDGNGGNYQRLIWKNDGSLTNFYGYYIAFNKLINNVHGGFGDGASQIETTNGSSLIINDWNHVVLVRDKVNNKIRFYVNNVNTDEWNDPTNDVFYHDNLSIGARHDSFGEYFSGDIDDVKIYKNRALTATEINNEYKKRLTMNPYLDDQTLTEGTLVKHVKPMNGANTWGDEQQFIEKYDKTAPTIDAITSVAGDTTAPYFDITDDSNTSLLFVSSDNLNEVAECRWSESDQTFDTMPNICASNSSCDFDLSGEGEKTVYMRCKDNIDNAADSSYVLNYTIDITPPNVLSITSVAGDAVAPYKDNTDDGDTAVVYSASPDAVACRWGETDSAYETMINTCESTSNCSLDLTGEGEKNIFMRCVDAAGLSSTSSYNFNYSIDTTPPEITSITSVAGDTTTPYFDASDDGNTQILFTASADTTECKWSAADESFDSMSNTCSAVGDCSVNLSGQGDKTVYIRCQDDTGNKMITSQQIDYTIDSVAPSVLSITSVANDYLAPYIDTIAPVGQTQVIYTASADTVACRWDFANLSYDELTKTCSSTSSCTITHDGDGEKNVFFRCIDEAGNKSTNGYELDFEVDENITGGGVTAWESSSDPSKTTNFLITFTPEITTPVTNGSVRLRLAPEYDLSTMTNEDVFGAGGDVIWTDNEVIYPDNNAIVFPFTGSLSNDDGQLSMTLADLQTVNPDSVGSYFVSYNIYDNTDGTGTPLEEGDGLVHLNHIVVVTATVPSFLEVAINPVGSGEIINGVTTNIATSNGQAVDFGIFAGEADKIAAHDIVISTNANSGYRVSVEYDHSLAATTNSIPDFIGTNANPLTWQTPPANGTNAYFGYTTADNSLLSTPINRFTDGKWSGFTTTPQEVIYENHTVYNQITRVGYRLQITSQQGIGFYSNNISYIITPTY